MAKRPENVIMVIADSLRYDSVYNGGTGLSYVEKNSVSFSEARAGGCWTLPATSSLFTGLVPHEHGAGSQTRAIHKDIPTLAERMKEKGYNTYQITANIATTEIFGLQRGFDEVRKIWKMVEPKFTTLEKFIVLLGKPRLRDKLFSGDLLMKKMSSDIEMAKTWLQHTFHDIFNEARAILKENEAKGQSSFIFINLMETHFPYHIAPTFKFSQDGIFKKLNELHGMFHLLNQTFLKKGYQNIKPKTLEVLKGRQRLAWKSLAGHVDEFCREMHEGKNNLVLFGSDHGENFGEDQWTYHFSNVTDGGNKVPMFWMSNEHEEAKVINTPVSTRHFYNSFMKAIDAPVNGPDPLEEPERCHPIMSSFWYNNREKTKDIFKFNQMAFVVDEKRYRIRNGQWAMADFCSKDGEPEYEDLGKGINPIEEFITDSELKAYFSEKTNKFIEFSSKISF